MWRESWRSEGSYTSAPILPSSRRSPARRRPYTGSRPRLSPAHISQRLALTQTPCCAGWPTGRRPGWGSAAADAWGITWRWGHWDRKEKSQSAVHANKVSLPIRYKTKVNSFSFWTSNFLFLNHRLRQRTCDIHNWLWASRQNYLTMFYHQRWDVLFFHVFHVLKPPQVHSNPLNRKTFMWSRQIQRVR